MSKENKIENLGEELRKLRNNSKTNYGLFHTMQIVERLIYRISQWELRLKNIEKRLEKLEK